MPFLSSHDKLPLMSAESPSSMLDVHPSTLRLSRPLLWIVAATLAWFLLTEGATEAWYGWRETKVPVTEPWLINWPTEEDATRRGFRDFQSRELGSAEQEILKFDKAESGVWRDDSGNQWTGFYLQWKSDKRLNQNDLSHNPTSCLPAAGIKLVSSESDTIVKRGKEEIPFRSWIFSMNGHPIYVFTATRRERELQRFDHQGDQAKKLLDKLSKPWFGNRGNPLQTMQFVVVGPSSIEVAREMLQSQVERLVSDH